MDNSHASDRQRYTGVVLAGGTSRRMGGTNKALMRHQGEHLFTYAVSNLQQHCQEILINTNADTDVFEDLGYRVIDDGSFMHMGPLAGILAASQVASSDIVLVAACDQLALPEEVYEGLVKLAESGKGAFASDGESAHPTCAAIPVSLASHIKDRLENSAADSSLLRLFSFMQTHCEELRFPSITFHNINTRHQMDSGASQKAD